MSQYSEKATYKGSTVDNYNSNLTIDYLKENNERYLNQLNELKDDNYLLDEMDEEYNKKQIYIPNTDSPSRDTRVLDASKYLSMSLEERQNLIIKLANRISSSGKSDDDDEDIKLDILFKIIEQKTLNVDPKYTGDPKILQELEEQMNKINKPIEEWTKKILQQSKELSGNKNTSIISFPEDTYWTVKKVSITILAKLLQELIKND